MGKKTLLLIDGKNLLWRNAAILQLSSGGQLTGGVHGFFRCMLHVHEGYPGAVTVCWDDWDNGPAERKRLYPDYKKRVHDEKREELNKEVLRQQQDIFKLLKVLGIRQTRSLGWEADDVMGTLARKWDGQVVIYTGDRDLFQCVSDRVAVLRPTKDGEAFYRPRDVEKALGVGPEQVTDYKSLVGDASDNIPGCLGIGPVAAKYLLTSFPTAESILEALGSVDEKLRPALREKLLAGKDNILLSKKLATINTHVELRHKRGELDSSAAMALLKKHQMTQLIINFSKLTAMRWTDEAK